jgi:hypothetical protein
MSRLIDVVTVPDFSGKNAACFTARTLFFLAAWMEHAGEARNFPIHLVCVGEPPPSVRRLAERCGARVTVHSRFTFEPFDIINKLRGLEVRGETDQVLLLDTDVFVLSDLRGISDLSEGLAAAPAAFPRVTLDYWSKIYAHLDMPMPERRIASVAGGLDRVPLRDPKYASWNKEAANMVPYYNGGIVLAPWNVELHNMWMTYFQSAQEIFTDNDPVWPHVGRSDQVGLAVALEELQRRGVPFCELPAPYHTLLFQLYRRAVQLPEVKLYHAVGIFSDLDEVRNIPQSLLDYRLQLLKNVMVEWAREAYYRRDISTVWRYLWPSLCDVYRLGVILQDLYRRHVAEALQPGG